jgi:predicted transposase YbfD/YdcC
MAMSRILPICCSIFTALPTKPVDALKFALRSGVSDPVAFEYIRHYQGWPDLNSIIRIERERRDGGKITRDTAYYISSQTADAATILDATQHHWAIEISFHWVLDVTFNEDVSRIRSSNSAENMALLHAVALNLLKQETSKSSLRQKRFRAAMDNDFLLHLLTQF